ncbi:MAG: dTMP kinase [Nitrososphaerota archaeon]
MAIEGVDGAGKTTQAKRLVRFLRSRGLPAYYTSEPTDSKYGVIIRQMLRRRGVNPYILALLFATDRLAHVEDVVKPLLRKGAVVVCDRYLYSSYAYQGVMTRRPLWVRDINSMAPAPDLAILLDVPVREALGRKKRRIVFEDPDFLEEVRSEYLRICEAGLMVRIDAGGGIKEVFKALLDTVLPRLGIDAGLQGRPGQV